MSRYNFSKHAWEALLQPHARAGAPAAPLGQRGGADLHAVGEAALDAVAVNDDGAVIAIGSCKWTSGEIPYSEKTKLEALAKHLSPNGPPPGLYFFARHGFAPQLKAEAERDPRINLLMPDGLV